MERFKMFKIGNPVQVSNAYLTDETGINAGATIFATVLSEPKDGEELVAVQYENGIIDYLPQIELSPLAIVVYTLEVQDGENRYKLNSPQKIQVNHEIELKEQINDFGEDLAKKYIGEGEKLDYGEWYDWYEIENGCRLIRYTGFEIIKYMETFRIIENILYK